MEEGTQPLAPLHHLTKMGWLALARNIVLLLDAPGSLAWGKLALHLQEHLEEEQLEEHLEKEHLEEQLEEEEHLEEEHVYSHQNEEEEVEQEEQEQRHYFQEPTPPSPHQY